jgi:hypothetical protein
MTSAVIELVAPPGRNDPTQAAVAYRFNEGTNSAGEPAAGPVSAPAPIDGTRKRGRPSKSTDPSEAPKKRGRPGKAEGASAQPAAPKTRDGTKQAQLIAMLRRKEGATIAQIVEATGWQAHSVRGALAGALKKKLGLTVTSEKVEAGERVYRIG